MSLSILLTNLVVAYRSGTEVVVEELADALRAAGHRPMLYSPILGAQAEAMRHRGHVVADRLAKLPRAPDVIHGHHTQTTMAAVAAFPGVPALFLCHDATAVFDRAPRHPRITRYFAVDALCRDRVVADGIPRAAVGILPNMVDLRRFPPRPPLPARPGRALVLTKNATHLPALRAACAGAGVALEELGPGVGRVHDALGDVLGQYDLVFATGRMALEAAAAGCAVVVGDARGLAGFLDEAAAEAWLPWNLGRGIQHRPADAAGLAAAIAAYDAGAAAAVAARIRRERSLADHVPRLAALYATMIAGAPAPDPAAEAMATAAFLEAMVPDFRGDAPWREMVWSLGKHVPWEETDPYAAALDARLGALHEEGRQGAAATQAGLRDLSAALAATQAGLRDQAAVLAAQQAGLRDQAAELAATRAALEARFDRLAQPSGAAARLDRAARGLWRRAVPRPLRARLQAWRSGRPGG